MFTQPTRASTRVTLVGLLVGLLVAILAATGLHVVVSAAGAAEAPVAGAVAAAAPQTWVVDAVDDSMGNRWVAQATGGSDLTIVAGDTVLWQAVVGTAAQGHDLTSTDDGTPWNPPVREALAPGGDDETFGYTFDEPGTYTYICATHETAPMIGTITVLAGAPSDNQAPTASPMVSLSSDSAPTTAAFMAHASDPDGDPLTYAWDFGDATDSSDQAAVPEPTHLYRNPGTYTVSLGVSDGTATTELELEVVVGGEGEPPLPDDALAVTASATPAGGTSRDVAFAAEVTGGREYVTGGDLQPFADGLTSYPDLRGTASLLRRPGSTSTSIDVTGLKPNASHLVHVHEKACSVGNGGAHFRFDTTLPFAEANEIWLPFTSDGAGRSGLQTELSNRRAGADAVSIVIHDPDNSARRIGCVDLVRDTSGLAAVWTFGDGTTGTGLRPLHVYRHDGRYTATVTVSDGQTGPVSDSIDVVVDAAAPETRIARGPSGAVRSRAATFGLASDEAGSTFACSVDGAGWRPCAPTVALGGLGEGAHTLRVRATDPAGRADATPAARRWTVDVTRPEVRLTRPGAVTRDRTPTLGARIVERRSSVARRGVELYVDGRRVAGVRYDARTGRVTWTPRGALSRTRHVVRLVAVDAAGNRAVETWAFRVR